MGRKRPGRKVGGDHYTLPQVTMLLLQAAELYQRVSSPTTTHLSDLYGKPNRSAQEEKVGEVHAEIMRRMNLGGDWETVLVGLIDLDIAMKRLGAGYQRGIASFLEAGPRHIDATNVDFRHGHERYVIRLWREMNGEQSDAQRANARLGIGRAA